MGNSVKTERLFVLRVIKYGEADLIVSGLNTMGAKIPLFAKAALKSRKRFGGGILESTHYIEATYNDTSRSFRGPLETEHARHHFVNHNHNFYFLKEATLLYDFHKIRTDYDRLHLGLYMLRLVNHFCQEGLSDNGQVFHLLGNSLRALEASKKLHALQMAFELRLLKIQGILEEDDSMKRVLGSSILEHEQLNIDPIIASSLKESIKNHFVSTSFKIS